MTTPNNPDWMQSPERRAALKKAQLASLRKRLAKSNKQKTTVDGAVRNKGAAANKRGKKANKAETKKAAKEASMNTALEDLHAAYGVAETKRRKARGQ